MKEIKLEKGVTLHAAGDTVSTLDLIISGTIIISDPYNHMKLNAGDICGLFEQPFGNYSFYYEVAEDCVLHSYQYESSNTVRKIIESEKDSRTMCIYSGMRTCSTFKKMIQNNILYAVREYHDLKTRQGEYPRICRMAVSEQKSFPELDLITPIPTEPIPSWQNDFIDSLNSHSRKLKPLIAYLDIPILTGIIMSISEFLIQATQKDLSITEYRNSLIKISSNFTREFEEMTAISGMKTDSYLSEQKEELANSLDTILAYSELDDKSCQLFKRSVLSYRLLPEEDYSTTNGIRLQKNITLLFTSIYEKVFFKSVKADTKISPLIRMFLYFGFMDETVLSNDNTSELFGLYKYVHSGKNVFPLYDWLLMIYNNEIQPSNNFRGKSFDSELRGQLDSDLITLEQYNLYSKSSEYKTSYEIRNLISIGSRIAYGKSACYLPFLNESSFTNQAENILVTPERFNTELNNLRSIDYSCFYQEYCYNNPDLEIDELYLQKEILPYVILMPNLGNSTVVWQSFAEGDVLSPARMLISVLHNNNLNDSVIKLCGNYRWEMCKASHPDTYDDTTMPSLTSQYNDYVRFYKKNHQLTPTQKDKITSSLKKYSNKTQNLFISDYLQYIKFEKEGSIHLNQIARDILCTYVPFSSSIRQHIRSRIPYSESINRLETHLKISNHAITQLCQKLSAQNKQIPPEIQAFRKFLNM